MCSTSQGDEQLLAFLLASPSTQPQPHTHSQLNWAQVAQVGLTSKAAVASLLVVLADVWLVVPPHCTAQELWSTNGSISAGGGGGTLKASRAKGGDTSWSFVNSASAEESTKGIR